ncbi:hypothetical protein I4U23_019807 [Adineta vaga]|nr:hypothetical protein I4U23_019807 [Adineta vaga]
MPSPEQINLAPVPTNDLVTVGRRGWSRRAKVLIATAGLVGLVVFTVTLLVPIIVTRDKYTSSTSTTTTTTPPPLLVLAVLQHHPHQRPRQLQRLQHPLPRPAQVPHQLLRQPRHPPLVLPQLHPHPLLPAAQAPHPQVPPLHQLRLLHQLRQQVPRPPLVLPQHHPHPLLPAARAPHPQVPPPHQLRLLHQLRQQVPRPPLVLPQLHPHPQVPPLHQLRLLHQLRQQARHPPLVPLQLRPHPHPQVPPLHQLRLLHQLPQRLRLLRLAQLRLPQHPLQLPALVPHQPLRPLQLLPPVLQVVHRLHPHPPRQHHLRPHPVLRHQLLQHQPHRPLLLPLHQHPLLLLPLRQHPPLHLQLHPHPVLRHQLPPPLQRPQHPHPHPPLRLPLRQHPPLHQQLHQRPPRQHPALQHLLRPHPVLRHQLPLPLQHPQRQHPLLLPLPLHQQLRHHPLRPHPPLLLRVLQLPHLLRRLRLHPPVHHQRPPPQHPVLRQRHPLRPHRHLQHQRQHPLHRRLQQLPSLFIFFSLDKYYDSISITLLLVLPSQLDVLPDTVEALWDTVAGGNSTLAVRGTGAGTYITSESIDNLFDGDLTTRYGSRGNSSSGNNWYAGINTGFYVTVAQCQPVLIGFRFGNAYNGTTREPLAITIEGTNCDDLLTCTNWTSMYSGTTGLDIAISSSSYGEYQPISNTNTYSSYRFLVTQKRNRSSYVSYSEVQLFGYTNYTAGSLNATANSSTLLSIKYGSIEPLWNTAIGGISELATEATSGVGTYLTSQGPDKLFDSSFTTRYSSRGDSNVTGSNTNAGLNTGFFFTIARCQTKLDKFRIAPGTVSGSDPTYVIIEGTSCSSALNCTSWTPLYSGPSGLGTITNRSSFGDLISIATPQAFASYRFTAIIKRAVSAYVSYSEIELYGY